MALMIDMAVHGAIPDPAKFGLKDFYHNAEGQVDYAYFYDSRNPVQVIDKKPQPRSKQRWKETCSEAAWDNMSYERNRHAERCNSMNAYEKWLEEWN